MKPIGVMLHLWLIAALLFASGTGPAWLLLLMLGSGFIAALVAIGVSVRHLLFGRS
jgi:hypothetical protein